MAYWIAKTFCGLFFKIGMGLRIYGLENVPQKGGFILASNHVSYLDPPLLAVGCPRVLHFMARHSLFDNRIFGILLRMVNVFPVRRGEADIGALKEAIRFLRSGEGLLIFPEGTRSNTGEIQKGKRGIGYLAMAAGAPILPAYVKGTADALPRGARALKTTRVSVYFGKIIEPSRLKLSEEMIVAYQEIADYIISEIKRLSEVSKTGQII